MQTLVKARDGAALSPGTACGVHQQIGVAQPWAGLQAAREKQHGHEGRRKEKKRNHFSPFMGNRDLHGGDLEKRKDLEKAGTMIPWDPEVHL